jgi:hypothetical protein
MGNDDSLFPENDDLEASEETQEAAEGSEAASVGNVVQLLPVHAAPNTGKNPLTVSRGRGRPRKVERMPTTSDLEYHAKMAEEKAKFVDGDPVVQAAGKTTDPMMMLSIIKAEVARETAALHFQRIENEKYGRDTAQVSTRRIDALKKIADIELEIKKLGASAVDVRSEQMLRVFKFFIETVRTILEDNLSPEQCDLIFNRFSTEFENWQDKLAEVLR